MEKIGPDGYRREILGFMEKMDATHEISWFKRIRTLEWEANATKVFWEEEWSPYCLPLGTSATL